MAGFRWRFGEDEAKEDKVGDDGDRNMGVLMKEAAVLLEMKLGLVAEQ